MIGGYFDERVILDHLDIVVDYFDKGSVVSLFGKDFGSSHSDMAPLGKNY